MLTEEGYDTKVHKPTVFDREMLALNKLKRPTKSKSILLSIRSFHD